MASVLVVEDNIVNMKLAVLLLHNADHSALCFADAETALTWARTERPDLILMDFQLPGMDGLTATTRLKNDPATADIPVILITAVEMKADLEMIMAAGCDAYIAKPLRYQELYAVIDTLLAKRQWQAGDGESDRTVTKVPLEAGQRGGAAVDVSVLEGLIGNDPVVILEFLVAFQTSAAAIAQELKAACADHQTVLAGRLAHKLKSAAYAVGALALGQMCATMSTAGREGSTEMLAKLLPLFEQELDAVNTFLDAVLARGTTA